MPGLGGYPIQRKEEWQHRGGEEWRGTFPSENKEPEILDEWPALWQSADERSTEAEAKASGCGIFCTVSI